MGTEEEDKKLKTIFALSEEIVAIVLAKGEENKLTRDEVLTLFNSVLVSATFSITEEAVELQEFDFADEVIERSLRTLEADKKQFNDIKNIIKIARNKK